MLRNILKSALIIATALSWQGCKEAPQKNEELRNVILARVGATDGDERSAFPGVIEENSSVSASFMADGRLARLLVKEGDRVRKGQLLAALDDSDYAIGVAQLEAQFAQMTKEKERMDAMFAKHNIAPNDYEKFEAGYEQLKLQLEMAKRRLDYTRLYAPADGYVAAKYMTEGELVGAGTPVYNIVDDSRLAANVSLPVGIYLNRGRIVSATGTIPGVEGEIPLSPVSFTPDPDNNMFYRMKLAIPQSVAGKLTSGMNIAVSLRMEESVADESTVPSRAIFREEGKNYVWVYDEADSTIHKKQVVVEGTPQGKNSTVKGLENGERIVETGVRQLYEGEKVNVLNRNDIGI